MPKFTYPIPDAYLQVERKVAMEMTKFIIGVAGKNDSIIRSFSGLGEQRPQFDSIDAKSLSRDSAHWQHSSKLGVTFNEEYIEEDFLTTTVHQMNNPNVFADYELGIRVCPIYMPTEGTLTLTYRCEDRHEAQMFRDRFRTKVSENRQEFTTKAEYEYGLPRPMLEVIHEVHRLRENVAGYDESFSKWFYERVSKKFTILKTMSGSNPEPVFKERQEGIVAYFDMTTVPEIQQEQNGSVCTVSFDFKYRYEKPAMLYIDYPLVVHQQLIGKKFRGDGLTPRFSKFRGSKSYIKTCYDYFANMYTFPDGVQYGFRFPWYDEWLNPRERRDVYNVVTAVLSYAKGVAPIDITQIPGSEFTEVTLEYLRANYQAVTRYGESPLHLAIFEGDNPISSDKYHLDENLNLVFDMEIDLRKTYRMQLMLLGNLTILTEYHVERWREHGEFTRAVLQSLFPGDPVDVKLVGGRVFPKKELYEYIKRAPMTPTDFKLRARHILMTVMSVLIKTRR